METSDARYTKSNRHYVDNKMGRILLAGRHGVFVAVRCRSTRDPVARLLKPQILPVHGPVIRLWPAKRTEKCSFPTTSETEGFATAWPNRRTMSNLVCDLAHQNQYVNQVECRFKLSHGVVVGRVRVAEQI